MDLPVIIALVVGSVVLLLFLLYRRLTKNYGYWEAQGIPTIKPRLFMGSTEGTFDRPPQDTEDERYKKYGRIYGTYEFSFRALNIADPQLAHQVLVKDFHIFTNRRNLKLGVPMLDDAMTSARDDNWKRIRTIVSPSFTSGKMRKMNSHFVDAAEGLIKNLGAAAESGDTIDAKLYFSSYSLDVIGLCAFGIRVDSLSNPDHPFAVNFKKIFAKDMNKWVLVVFIIPGVMKLFGNWVLRRLGFTYFAEVVEEIIRKRKAMDQSTGQVDLVKLMLDAREGKLDKDEQDEPHPGHFYQDNEGSAPRPAWNITRTLSDSEIKAQATQFFTAGHDPISTALSYAARELALHPDIQEKVYEEIQETCKSKGEINYDAVGKMPYLEAVISETLRLHTIAFRLEREASQDYVLGSTGIRIPKGGIVMILIHCMHHDPEWFPEPYKFQPDRFLPENRGSLTPYAYLPFSDGPRNCLAMRFALLELKLCLAMVLKEIKFVATEETKGPVKVFHNPGVLIPREMKMKVEKRK